MQSLTLFPTAAFRVARGEIRVRAQPVIWIFMLRARAARNLLHEQNTPCRGTASDTTIRANCSMDQASNLQFGDRAGTDRSPAYKSKHYAGLVNRLQFLLGNRFGFCSLGANVRHILLQSFKDNLVV